MAFDLVTAADLGTTWVGLNRGGRELNPILGNRKEVVARRQIGIHIGVRIGLSRRGPRWLTNAEERSTLKTLTYVRGGIVLWNLGQIL